MREIELEHLGAEALEAADHPEAEIGDIPDDRSSSLSEPEDVDDEEEGLSYVTNGARGHNLPPAQKTLEVDSEAETERLEESPQKLRQHADIIGRTPSKLSKAAGIEDDLSEPPSPLPAGPGAASSTSTIETVGKASPGPAVPTRPTGRACDANATDSGQKRKRSDADDSPLTSEESDIEQSPRKRSHGLATHPLEGEVAQSTEPNGVDYAHEVEEVEIADIVEPEDLEVPAALPLKGLKGKRGRKPGRKPKAQGENEEADIADPAVGTEGDEVGVDVGPKRNSNRREKRPCLLRILRNNSQRFDNGSSTRAWHPSSMSCNCSTNPIVYIQSSCDKCRASTIDELSRFAKPRPITAIACNQYANARSANVRSSIRNTSKQLVSFGRICCMSLVKTGMEFKRNADNSTRRAKKGSCTNFQARKAHRSSNKQSTTKRSACSAVLQNTSAFQLRQISLEWKDQDWRMISRPCA
jgi:hypothetical protein